MVICQWKWRWEVLLELTSDERKVGSCLWITNRRGMEYWPAPIKEAKCRLPISKWRRKVPFKASLNLQIPKSFEEVVVYTSSHNFRSATSIVCVPLRLPIKPRHVLGKIIYAGINASDVDFSSGCYFGGNEKDLDPRLPFDVGFEAAPFTFEPDKSDRSWSWLKRCMVVRPWENCFLDVNLRDEMMIRENGLAERKMAPRPVKNLLERKLSL